MVLCDSGEVFDLSGQRVEVTEVRGGEVLDIYGDIQVAVLFSLHVPPSAENTDSGLLLEQSGRSKVHLL